MNLSVQFPIFVTSCMLITSLSSACGQESPLPLNKNHSGIFAGIQGGGIHGASKNSRVRLGGVLENISTYDSLSDTKGIVGAQIFMGTTCCNAYVGMEIWGNNSFLNLKMKDNVYFKETLKLKIKQSYGVAARIGMIFGSTLLYVKPGIVFSKREVFSQFRAIFISGSSGPVIPSYKSHKYMHGFSFSMGVDVPIYRNQFMAGVEANGTFYQSFNYIHPMPTGITGDIKTHFKPSTYSLLLKLNYRIYPY